MIAVDLVFPSNNTWPRGEGRGTTPDEDLPAGNEG